MLLSRRTILSLFTLTTAVVATGIVARAEEAIEAIEPDEKHAIVPSGDGDYDYPWTSHTHTFTLTEDQLSSYQHGMLCELREKSSNETFPIGTRMYFIGQVPRGWVVV